MRPIYKGVQEALLHGLKVVMAPKLSKSMYRYMYMCQKFSEKYFCICLYVRYTNILILNQSSLLLYMY